MRNILRTTYETIMSIYDATFQLANYYLTIPLNQLTFNVSSSASVVDAHIDERHEDESPNKTELSIVTPSLPKLDIEIPDSWKVS